MARRHLRNYLRTHRKRWALSQKQLSDLLGIPDGNPLSRYESDKRLPNLKTALACEAIFGIPASVLFAGLYDEVEEDVMRRAKELFEDVEHRRGAVGERNRALLMDMLARATNDQPSQ